ncbi:MAG: hypothetical protein LV481_12455 [Methylacidiphilales bacterium]|nr:hypothetical protein [Candidatus Methylacidiphilales bacterium]
MSTASPREETLARLALTLDEYLAAVPRQKEPDPPDLMALFARLDALENEIDSSYPAQLRHYLHQKSYRKAWLYLQGREAENLRGNCGK